MYIYIHKYIYIYIYIHKYIYIYISNQSANSGQAPCGNFSRASRTCTIKSNTTGFWTGAVPTLTTTRPLSTLEHFADLRKRPPAAAHDSECAKQKANIHHFVLSGQHQC